MSGPRDAGATDWDSLAAFTAALAPPPPEPKVSTPPALGASPPTAAVQPPPPRRSPTALFDATGWLAVVESSSPPVMRPAPAGPHRTAPARYPWMARADAELGLKYRDEDAVSDSERWPRVLGVRVLQQAWSDAAWQYSEIPDPSPHRYAVEKRDKKRRRRELDRLDAVGFFFAPPAPQAWGWLPTLDGWCDVLDLDVGLVRQAVEWHLRALSPLHGRLVDAVRADLVQAAPGRRKRPRV